MLDEPPTASGSVSEPMHARLALLSTEWLHLIYPAETSVGLWRSGCGLGCSRRRSQVRDHGSAATWFRQL